MCTYTRVARIPDSDAARKPVIGLSNKQRHNLSLFESVAGCREATELE